MEFKNKDKGILTLPGKGLKKPALYLRRGDSIRKVANFKNRDAMEVTELFLKTFLEGDNDSI